MGRLFTLILLAAVVVWLLRGWLARREADAEQAPAAGVVFRVAFRAGRRVRVEGRIPRNALAAFDDIAAHARLEGEIRLDRDHVLAFSEEVDPGVRQQLRNAWIASVNVH